MSGQLAAPETGASVALSRACIAACTGGVSSGATSCARNDIKGARIARGGIEYGPGLSSFEVAGTEDTCWMPGKLGGACNASSSRLPEDHESIEDADIMGDSCRTEVQKACQ
jgi:hypothetical protein